MDYNLATLHAATGDILMLPNFVGYFKWDYGTNQLMFYNRDYKCKASDLDVQNRTDWYYII